MKKRAGRGIIDRLKFEMRYTKYPFSGHGYYFKKALSELRREGINIKYIKQKCHYVRIDQAAALQQK